MYFTGSPFESAFDPTFEWGLESADLGAPFFFADIRRAKAGDRRSAVHSAALSQLDWVAICIRDDELVRPIIVWKMRRARCLFRSVARKGNGPSIYRGLGRQ